MIHINGTLLENAFQDGSNATIGDGGLQKACPLFSQLTCEEDSIEMLQTIFYACAILISGLVCVLSVLVCLLVIQIKRMSRLLFTLRSDQGGAGGEVRNSLLAAPELRSSFQSKAKKATKKTAKFTDPSDTACSTPRDVDEEDL